MKTRRYSEMVRRLVVVMDVRDDDNRITLFGFGEPIQKVVVTAPDNPS